MGLRQLCNWQSAWIVMCLLLTTTFAWAEGQNSFKAVNYTNQQLLSEMLLVDATEQTLDNAPALVITFSQDLDTNTDPSEFLTVTTEGKAVVGQWAVIKSLRRLYFTQIQANTNYRIQIRPGITAKNGLKLLKPADFEIKTREIQPAFDFANKGSLLPAHLDSGLPIRVVNVPELDVEFLRVQPEKLGEVLKTIRLDNTLQSWELEEIHAVTTSVYTARYPNQAKPNAREIVKLPIAQIEALKQPGLYFAVIRRPGRFTDKAYRISHFVITNIGLQARVYEKKLEVFAHALDTGKPLRGIKIAVNDNEATVEANTDELGRASFAKHPEKNFFVTAMSADNQFAFLDLRSQPLDLSQFPIHGLPAEEIAPYLYSSRTLYRPSDQVDLNILLRDQDGLVNTSKTLRLSIVRPDTKIIWDDKLTAVNADLGYYLQHFKLPEDAPEGIWRAELRLDDESRLSGVLEFQVERYQAASKQLKLNVGKDLITKDDKQIVSLQGSYEYGGATAGQRIVATRNLQIASQPLGEAFKAYSFGLPEDAEQLEAAKLPELSLDPQGNGFLEFPALASAIQSPLITTIRASLLELGGRPTTSELQQAYWPAQHLIGLKPLFEKANVAANSEARFDIIRVDPAGNLLAAQHLTATLFSESYDYYWEYAADQGWQQKGIRNQYPVSQQILDIPAGQHGQLALLVSEGKYRLEVEDADTKLKAAYAFTAGWENTATSLAEPNSLELKLDKAMYKTGETAKLAVNLPMSSEALVTVEGGQLLWSKQLSLAAGDSVIDIPLEAAWLRHDLYVAVNALEADPNQQQKTIRRRFGILPLVLDRSERQLDLSIEAPETITAEQDLKIVVRANHLNSEDALVTVAAMDVQLAEQTVQPRPDPYSFYFSSHAYEARLYDDYNRIIADAEIPMLIKDILPEAPTSNPLPPQLSSHLTTLVSDPVKFDAEGKAEINFKLPPFVGNLHLQATAITANQFGSVSKELQVVAPIQVNLKAPSFLATGDQGFLRLELKNVSELDQALQLKINSNDAIEGVALDKTLSLSKGQNELLQLPIKTLSSLGLGQINLEIIGKDFQLKRQLNIPIRPAYAPVITYEQHELLGLGKSTELSNQANRYLANTAETCLSIANTPSLPVATMVRNLMHYPYESLEQIVSSTYPYLFLDEAAAQKWDLPPTSLAQRTQQVQEALTRLRSMQLPKGGFSAWAKLGPEEYWLDAYVTEFLLDARQQGFTVPASLIDAALTNLQQSWQQDTPQLEERYPLAEKPVQMDLAVRAYIAYVLARQHKMTLNDLKAFVDKAAPQLELGLPLVHLGLALSLQGDATRGDELIQKGLNIPRKDDSYLGDYGSALRDRAMMLYQLLLADQTVSTLTVHIDYVLRDIQEHKYLSTQEQVFVFLLGQILEKQSKASWQAQLVVDGKVTDLAQIGSFNRCYGELKTGSKIVTNNDDALYVSLMTTAYPAVSPEATAKPIMIQRKWYKLTGEVLNPEEMKVGDLVLTRLTIESAEPIPHALVVDLLPSGVELEQGDLQDNEVLQALKLDDMAVSVAETMAYSGSIHESFWSDRYVVNLELKAKADRTLFYLARVRSPAIASIPQAYVVDLDQPYIQGLSTAKGVLHTMH